MGSSCLSDLFNFLCLSTLFYCVSGFLFGWGSLVTYLELTVLLFKSLFSEGGFKGVWTC